MKTKVNLLITILLMIFTAACKKDNLIITSGSCSATINGQNWTANYVKAGKTDSTIAFMAQIQKLNEFKEPYPYDILDIHIMKNKGKQIVGEISTVPYAYFYTAIEQGHATNERFEVLEADTENNWVQITEESNDYKEIKGKFSLTLIKTSTGIDPNRYPDTLRIRNGEFSVTLE